MQYADIHAGENENMIEHATMVWRLAEQANVEHIEFASYTFALGFNKIHRSNLIHDQDMNLNESISVDLLSDVGGTVGLFLGLNLIAVVQVTLELLTSFRNRHENINSLYNPI